MLAKSDSEVASQTNSSPGRSSTGRPIYYVQSPSRDSQSHDGEKTTLTATTSFRSTPAHSPMGSPPHSHHSSLGPTSRESSSTRFSGLLKPRKEDGSGRRGRRKPWHKHFDAIEEEGLLVEDEMSHGLPRRCYFPAFVVGFFLLFAMFSVILWGASKPQKPVITMKSIVFDSFQIQAGSDTSGVSTDMASLNATVKLTFRNAATFFGVHVTSTPLSLSYSQLTIATGSINKFYQSRKSQKSMTVTVTGSRVPLYGGSASISSSGGKATAPVPLTLSFVVRSRAYVLGRLVKPKFYKRVDCQVTMDPLKMSTAISLKNVCTYL